MQIRGRTTDQLRIGSDDSLDCGETVRIQLGRHESGIVLCFWTLSLGLLRHLGQLLAADDLELAVADKLLERLRVCLDDEQIIRKNSPASAGDIAPIFVANDGNNRYGAAGRILELGHPSASKRRGRPDSQLARVVLDLE